MTLTGTKKMAWRFVQQPNGKLARFSDIVDHFTDVDMTDSEAYIIGIFDYDCTPSSANKKIRAAREDWLPWTSKINPVHGDGLARWRDSIETIALLHGLDKALVICKCAVVGNWDFFINDDDWDGRHRNEDEDSARDKFVLQTIREKMMELGWNND